MSDPADFIEEVWRLVNVILQDLADTAVTREIVRAAYRTVEPQPVGTREEEEDEQLAALTEAARDLCVAHLLRLARRDLSPRNGASRPVCLLLEYFEPQIRASVERRIDDPDEADAVANVVRTKLWSCLGRFKGERRQLHAYIQRICDSARSDWSRKIPRRRGRDGDWKRIEFEELCDHHEGLELSEHDSRAREIVRIRMFLKEALPLLPPHEKQAVCAFLTHDSWVEAERALGIPRQTLFSRFKVAVGRLAHLLGLS
jgi:DNA-directed RNA polymerase specialized sigma24 family protein